MRPMMLSFSITWFLLVRSLHATSMGNSTNCKTAAVGESIQMFQRYAGRVARTSQSKVKEENQHVTYPRLLTISGAKGANADAINGPYERIDENYDDKPQWRKVGNENVWLVYVRKGNTWNVMSKAFRDAGKGAGWMTSVTKYARGPTNVSEWSVWDGSWIQQNTVSIVEGQPTSCTWSNATVMANKRCSIELWEQRGMDRAAAENRCNHDHACLGLMWFNNYRGEGHTSITGWYRGCGGSAGHEITYDWDTILKPPEALACG